MDTLDSSWCAYISTGDKQCGWIPFPIINPNDKAIKNYSGCEFPQVPLVIIGLLIGVKSRDAMPGQHFLPVWAYSRNSEIPLLINIRSNLRAGPHATNNGSETIKI